MIKAWYKDKFEKTENMTENLRKSANLAKKFALKSFTNAIYKK